MIDKNTSGLAGELLVAGELSRRGYPVSITMGKAKAVDIYADTQEGIIKVSVKASHYSTSWPIRKFEEKIYYILVFLQNAKGINKNAPPEYYIISPKETSSNKLITPWKSIPGIKYSSLNVKSNKNDKEEWDYKERWDKLPPLPPSLSHTGKW